MGELDKIDDGLKKIEEGAKKTFNVFENNKNVIIVVIILIFVISLFVGGIFLGKRMGSNSNLKQIEKSLKKDIKQTEAEIKTSTKNAKSLIDSAGIYEEFALRQAVETQKRRNKTKKVISDCKKIIDNVDNLSKQENMKLFSKLAQEYIDSTD